MERLNRHVEAFNVLKRFIERSIKQGEGHRFGLPRYNDSPSSELVPEVSAGYDQAFCMRVSGVLQLGAK